MTSTLRARALAAARVIGASALLSAPLAAVPAPASASVSAVGYVPVNGSGSSWAAVAIDQWALDKRANGIVINYNPDGSATGRTDWEEDQDDFTGSDPPFRNGHDELAGITIPERPNYGYSYVPDVAGGTAFMYHLNGPGGHLITNLRLSGQTLMKIFTGQITNWDDPAITHDYGAQLPSLPITPVVRADGSGATFFLTRWMSTVYPQDWSAFCQKVHPGIQLPCPETEFYPANWGAAKSENGSTNVANYITSSYGNGAIGYDEYAYALSANYPVVKMLNPGGYYVLPSASNVAVALTQAQIVENQNDPNFLQQNLNSVYTYNDPRSYPLSSYSYFIVPRQGSSLPVSPSFNTAKGATLSTWLNFDICEGQRQVIQLGYSPLPYNLVKGALLQINHIPGHIATTPVSNLAGCGNPTINASGQNVLLSTAPQPSPCDKLGAPLNCTVKNGKPVATGPSKSTGGTTGATPGASTGPTGSNGVPGTTGNNGVAPAATNGPVNGVTVNLASADRSSQVALATITTASIIAAIAIPPVLAAWLRRRRQHD
jgi:ABC-type phosphate transport system substrate-binding protein